MSISELGCSYATMILHDDGIPITAEKITTLLKAANVEYESYWPGLFAKLAEKKNIEDIILNVGGGGGAAPAFAGPVPDGPAVPDAVPTPDGKKKEEVEEESDDDFVSGLFD